MDNIYINNTGKSIDIIHFILEALKHWKTLVVILIICAVTGGGFSYYSQKKAINEFEATQDVEDSIYELDENTKTNMEMAYTYRELYREQKEYNDNSILMQLNPNEYAYGKAVYYICAVSEVDLITAKCQAMLDSTDILKRAAAIAGDENDYKYIREVLFLSVSYPTDTLSDVVMQVDQFAEPVGKGRIITIEVEHMDLNVCSEILQMLQKQLEDMVQTLNVTGDEENTSDAGITFELVSSDVRTVFSSAYRATQKENVERLKLYYSGYNNIESSFGEKDLEYYRMTYLAQNEDADVDDIVMKNISAIQKKPMIKMAIVFAFFGGGCWLGWIGIRYFGNDIIKTCHEFRDYYNVPIIGGIECSPRKKGMLEVVQKKIDYSVCGQPASEEYLATCVNSLLDGAVSFVNVAIALEDLTCVKNIAQKCNGARVIGSLTSLETDFSAIKEQQGVILCVNKNCIRNSEIRREIDICVMQGIPVQGVIFVF